jgi:parallel beta-helix repeat protein
MDTSDAGAFYIGRDYSERGNVVRFNYFHELGKADVQAIYLDDFASGTTVYGNVVYKAARGVLIGGGRDNVIRNNVFAECSKHSVHLDARGLGWARKFFDGSNTTLTDRLKAVNHTQPPYSIRYPRLVGLYDGNPALPEGNVIANNISYRGTWLDLANGLTSKDLTLDGNLVDGDPGFVDYSRQNFQLKADSPAFLMGFKRIPLEKIGIYRDEYRTTER